MAETAFGVLRKVVERRKEVGNTAPYPPLTSEGPVDPRLFKYFFDTQQAIEREGPMNYHLYAARVWSELVDPSFQIDSLSENSQFMRFERNLVLGLQDIDMRQHVYEDLSTNLKAFAQRYGPSVKKVAIWSTGDETATGYQPAKVARSGILRQFAQALGSDCARAITDYLVADNKFNKLHEYLTSQTDIAKLVVIEDSRSNLRRVREMIDELNTTRPNNPVEFYPVWAAYSREGQEAKERAIKESKLDEFEQEKAELHAVDKPSDLLDSRFNNVFPGAHVLVDFDGVIGNNLTMRQAQAQIKYNNLLGAVMEQRGINQEQSSQVIKRNLTNLLKKTTNP